MIQKEPQENQKHQQSIKNLFPPGQPLLSQILRALRTVITSSIHTNARWIFGLALLLKPFCNLTGLSAHPRARTAYKCVFHSPYRSLLASRSDSRSVSTSPSLTGPFTFLMMERLLSSMNSTRTCKGKTTTHFF